jgi:hypothetical protein
MATPTARPMRAALFVPLILFLVPTIVIGYGFVIPGSAIAGVNEHTIGFATSLVAASVTYVMGIRQALRS